MYIRKFLFIFILNSSILFASNISYSRFIDAQIDITKELNSPSITEEKTATFLKKQNRIFEKAIGEYLVNKQKIINNSELFEREIFSLKRTIAINKKAGNQYAILRDELALKSFLLVRSQNIMMKNILFALDKPTVDSFEEELNNYVNENQREIQKLYAKDYSMLSSLNPERKIIKHAQDNLEKFHLLRDVNSAMISYLYTVENKMYRLNKYSKYHIIKMAIYVNSIDFVKSLNPVLEIYGLDLIKLIVMGLLSLLILFFRKIIYVTLEKYFLKIDFLEEYSKDILQKIRKTIEIVIIIININMVIYVYNDFSSNLYVAKIFNIIYGFYFTLLFYIIINTVASIKISTLEINGANIKNDLINVGIKIVNFIIIMIGVLIILFFAGINLTAVLSGLGIGGLAVAFAAKDTISNFFGTLSILFSNVFSQGDWIVVNGNEGVVVEIGLRVTTLRTFDNALIAIPNGTFAAKDVKNWNKRVLGRRIKMSLGIKYSSQSQDIKNAITDIRTMLKNHPEIATKETKYEHQKDSNIVKLVSKNDLEGVKSTLLVYLDSFEDSSINILIYCFTKSVQWEEWLIVKEDVMHKIMNIFEKNNIEFAFPSLSLYNHEIKKS